MIRRITATEAKPSVQAGAEIAFLDVREAGQFGEGHPLFAVPCPYSRLEPMALRLVPNPGVPIILIDAGDGVAERAAASLAKIGYSDLSIVAGGAPSWKAAGFTLFKGVNVPSKTLGELAEHEWRPDLVDARTFRQWQSAGAARLFDGRPPVEYRKMHVPGATCMPNGELAQRIDALGLKTGDRLVVGCAGRTRGIIGAIGLKLMGCPGEVYALENGTQGWALAGMELERGVPPTTLPELSPGERETARGRAAEFLARWRIPTARAQEVAAMLADPAASTFVFDVRSEAEAAADPVACAPHAPGGQLVQATDQYVGVRHGRIVLCDDTGVRAGLAAFWLRQLGFEVHVAALEGEMRNLPAAAPPGKAQAMPTISAAEAMQAMSRGTADLLDLRSSTAYRTGHVREADWTTRARIPEALRETGRQVLLVGDDEEILACAGRELAALGADHAAVAGGHAALISAGAEEVATPDRPSDEQAIDFLRFVHDRHDGNLEASRRYLEWEMGLIAQLDPEERRGFKLAEASAAI